MVLESDWLGCYRRYKIIVAYDGADYFGWQEQAQEPTIAEILQHAFKKVFKKDIKLSAASRTDAGVHALGQVASFKTDLVLSPDRLMQAWNNKLPVAIAICDAQEVPLSFNPHHNVIEKIYRYSFCLQRPSPFEARYIWYYRWPVVFEKLQEALALFVGKHDFRSFCCSEYTGDTVREIYSITLSYHNDVCSITFKAPAFLRYMIRRIVGACLQVASHRLITVNNLKTVLLARNPAHTFENAPACGLTLVSIEYKNGIFSCQRE